MNPTNTDQRRRTLTIDGNEAAASIAHRVSEVIAIYPITPSSPIGELADEWSSQGRKNLWGMVPDVVEMQSEAVGHPQAERVLVLMGSGAETAHETVEQLVDIFVELLRAWTTWFSSSKKAGHDLAALVVVDTGDPAEFGRSFRLIYTASA